MLRCRRCCGQAWRNAKQRGFGPVGPWDRVVRPLRPALARAPPRPALPVVAFHCASRCIVRVHGGPRHIAAMARAGSNERWAGTTSSVNQRPFLQCGQQSISMAATRRMKACASSRACEFAAGIASSWRASASRPVLAAAARAARSGGCA